jgi:GH18 family chitinase
MATFGTTTSGSSTYLYQGGYSYSHAFRKQMNAENGTLTSLHILATSVSGGIQIGVALYTDNAGEPNTLITGSGLQVLANGWNSFTIGASLTANTWYHICIWGNTGTFQERYDSGGYAVYWNDQSVTPPNWDDPFAQNGDDGVMEISAYGTYTPESVGETKVTYIGDGLTSVVRFS